MNNVRIFTPGGVENHFNHADFTAQLLGINSQHDWTKSIDKMNFHQLADDAAKKYEVAQAVNFKDLAKQAEFSQLQSEYNNYFNKLFLSGIHFPPGCVF